MKILFERDKHSISELALLGIFVLGILASWAIVTYKARVKFSDPVPLPFSGIAASLPAGEGWYQLEHWKYDDQNNSFVLAVQFQNADVFLQWEYLLAEPKGDAIDIAKNTIDYLGGAFVGEGTIRNGDLVFAWAQFAQASRDKEGIVAIADLASGRHLKLILLTEEESMLKDAFKGAVASIKYIPNDLTEQGIRFVSYLKTIKVSDLVRAEAKSDMERIYTVRKVIGGNDIDSAIAKLVGFTVERFSDVYGNFGWTGVKAKRFQYLNGQREWSDKGDFECNENFNEFTWLNTNVIAGTDKTTTEIKVIEGGVISIAQKEKHFLLSDLSIPEILVESVARAFLDYDSEKVLIDIVMHDGRIIPAIMSKMKSKSAEGQGHPVRTNAYEIRLDFLYKAGVYEDIHFNSDKEIIRKISKSTELLVIEKSSWQEIFAKFSELSKTFEELFPSKNRLKK